MRFPVLLLVVISSLACKDSGDDSACNAVWFEDADGDGFGSPDVTSDACAAPDGYADNADDCDDGDAAVGPGAEEACDGLDNDCDGEVDEDGLTTIYLDGDGDGYGDDETAEEGCADSSGVVTAGGDCDDGDPAVSPGAEEVCDGVDNDCSGAPDDDASDALTWYSDDDGDGYGDPAASLSACVAPSGAVADATDCDDGYDLRYPGAEEVCNDGVVNDCDGSEADARAACVLEAEVSLSDADAKLQGGARDDTAGGAIAGAGDANGDGLDDLLVGATGQSEAGDDAGAVYLVLEARGDTALLSSAARWLGEAGGDRAGWSVASGGDVLGDGHPTAIIGAPGESSGGADAGAVYLVSTNASGAVSLAGAPVKFTGAAAGDAFGRAVAGGFDLTGDGTLDTVVGAPSADSAAGALYVFEGGAASTGALNAQEIYDGASAGDGLGGSVAVGDVDGDGVGDLLSGARNADPNGSQSGEALLVYAPAVDGSQTSLEGPRNGDAAGHAVAVGDLNADGRDDLIIGAPTTGNGDNGAVYLVFGSAAQLSARVSLSAGADAVLSGAARESNAGSAVGVVPDVDGDGDSELVIGATGGGGAGTAFLVLGGALSGTLDLGDADSVMSGERAGDAAGGAVAGVGDFDGDGAGDLLIGAIGEDTGGDEAGAAYLILGPGI